MLKIICHNRKAFHDYFIEETIEAGIALKGTEVKSLRQGKANLKDSYVIIKGGEVRLLNCHISPYSHGNIMNHEPLRTRKLLLHRKEIERLGGKVSAKGYALIPLKLYFKDSFVKIEIGLVKGKKLFEKRDIIKKREAQREIEKALRGRKGSTEVMRIRSHAVVPSPRKKAETNTKANNELALAA